MPALTTVPAGLATFRREQGESLAGMDPSPQWETFRSDQAAYQELLNQLAKRQQGLCGYCEQRVVNEQGGRVPNDYQVEHVAPKSDNDDHDNTLDAGNLMLCCAGGTWLRHFDPSRGTPGGGSLSCGQSKGYEALPDGCDPRTFPFAPSLVHVDAEGVMHVHQQRCSDAGIDPLQLKRAINRLLNLNCERLRKARKTLVADISFHLEYEYLAVNDGHVGEATRRKREQLLAEMRLAPDHLGFLRAFWSTELCTLGDIGEAWVAQNHARLNFDAPTQNPTTP